MRKVLIAVLACLATVGLSPVAAHSTPRSAPKHALSVSGNGVAMYPAFSPSVRRYAITTTDKTAGAVRVTAETTARSGSVWIDGQPAAGGTKRLSGLSSGDEISVFIKDSSGTAVYSLIYLPPGFPTLDVVTKQPGIAPGYVFLTLSDFTGTTPGYDTIVDRNGVPIYVQQESSVPLDFKRQSNGDYSVGLPTTLAGRTGVQIIDYNDQFEQVAAYSTVNGLVNTDGHDSIVLPNGDRWLLATEPNSDTKNLDAVIQEQSPTGQVLFQWSTADHVDPALDSVQNGPDYAHINSIWLMKNGDILASFRHLSQVMEIATHAHGGYQPGDIVWSLGGKRPTLQTVGDPHGGPCAQHAASQLPNGDILMYDDGSESINGSPLLCVNPHDRTGPSIARPQTRIVEYSINQTDHTATKVWSFQIDNRDTVFAGSAQRLSNGDTMIGWASNTQALATEVTPSKKVVWELKDTAGLFSYRSLKFAAPDKIAPAVDLTTPAKDATYTYGEKVHSEFICTDRGGSSLHSCAGSTREGASLDTSASGTHTFTVRAKDGAGNTTTVKRTYHVVGSPYRPDALIRTASGHYVGAKIYDALGMQTIRQSISSATGSATAVVRLRNRGAKTDRLTVRGSAGTSTFHVRYFEGHRDVTTSVVAGTFRTPALAAGAALSLRLEITRTTRSRAGNHHRFAISATSTHDSGMNDAVATVVRAQH